MYLYSRNNGKIEVYSMIPKKDEMAKYRMQEMEKIPYKERCIEARTSMEKRLENTNTPIYLSNLVEEDSGIWGRRIYHSLTYYNDDKLMNGYYNGEYSNLDVALVQDYSPGTKDYEIVKYLLLTNNKYKIDLLSRDYYMPGIISIPESLYLLQMLEQGNLYMLKDKDIYDQLQLFDIPTVPKSIYDMETLKRMSDEGLIPGGYYAIMSNVATTEKILSKSLKGSNK